MSATVRAAQLLTACALAAGSGCATPRAVPAGSDPALEQQLERAAQPAPGPRYFFLGVALSDRSPAFTGDIRILDRILGHHYGEAYRSVLLSNQEQLEERRDLPLATQENVEAAVQRLRAVRRPEDRFILLFTSHGTRGILAEQRREPRNVNLKVRSAALGRWVRLLEPNRTWVIVSACYAGSHLDHLAGSQVVVMTASDASHASMGCGTLNRSTFFVGALARSLEFDRTFAQLWSDTGERIRRWEKQLGYEGSSPQVQFGEGLGDLEQEPLSGF